MLCRRCGSKCTRKKVDKRIKKGLQEMGIPFGGSYVCLKCYHNTVLNTIEKNRRKTK